METRNVRIVDRMGKPLDLIGCGSGGGINSIREQKDRA